MRTLPKGAAALLLACALPAAAATSQQLSALQKIVGQLSDPKACLPGDGSPYMENDCVAAIAASAAATADAVLSSSDAAALKKQLAAAVACSDPSATDAPGYSAFKCVKSAAGAAQAELKGLHADGGQTSSPATVPAASVTPGDCSPRAVDMPSAAGCLNGEGLYCGGSTAGNGVNIGGDPNVLYICRHGKFQVAAYCPGPCVAEGAYVDDHCVRQ